MDLFQNSIDKVNKLKQAKELVKHKSPALKRAIHTEYCKAKLEYEFQRDLTILKVK